MCSHSNIKGQNVAFKKTLSPCISYITNIKDEWAVAGLFCEGRLAH